MLDKIIKALGQDTVQEMEAMDDASLRKVIVEANSAMKQVKEELEDNPKYQELKENLKALSQGKRDVDKRQKARIAFALSLMDKLGQSPV